jgi:hypothetical integral membrane protein (TIGR02206 family)
VSLSCRRNLVPHPVIRAALGCLLVGGELLRYQTAHIRFPDTLPLNLCNVTTWVAVIACLTLSPMAVEFAYFAGFSGAGMALLTPNSSALSTAFFLNHGAIILTGSALIYGRIATLRRSAAWRAYASLLLYMGLIGLFDWRYRVNYSFLCAKPASTTLLTFLGPWPYYLVGAGVVGLALFWLLSLPVRSFRYIPRKTFMGFWRINEKVGSHPAAVVSATEHNTAPATTIHPNAISHR